MRFTWRLRPSWIVSSTTAPEMRRTCAGAVLAPSSSSFTPVGELAQDAVGRLLPELGDVDLVDLVLRMREPVRELAVVREQDRAGRVGVEAADGNDARRVVDEADDRRAALRVARGRDDAGRLVQQHVGELLLLQRLAVEAHVVGALRRTCSAGRARR